MLTGIYYTPTSLLLFSTKLTVFIFKTFLFKQRWFLRDDCNIFVESVGLWQSEYFDNWDKKDDYKRRRWKEGDKFKDFKNNVEWKF